MSTVDSREWADRIPHCGPMALIERVLAYHHESIRATADNHRSVDHPLRRGDRLRAIHLCEYGAQSMAVHGALIARDSGQGAHPGLLVALRGVVLHVERFDDRDGVLEVSAVREHADARAWLYRFVVHNRGDLLAEGRAMVMLETQEQGS